MIKQDFIRDYIFYGSISKLRKNKISYEEIKYYLLENPMTYDEMSNPPNHHRYNAVNEYSTIVYEYLVVENLIDPLWNIPLLHSSIYNVMTNYYFNTVRFYSFDSVEIINTFAKIYKHNYKIIPHIINCQITYRDQYAIINLTDDSICLFIDECIELFDSKFIYYMPITDLLSDNTTYTHSSIYTFIAAKKKSMYVAQKERCSILKEYLLPAHGILIELFPG